MVKHIIIWNFKEELSADERAEYSAKIKAGLEGLKGVINGLTDIKVYTEPLASSNGDLMLDSTFVSKEALAGYQTNPDHLKVAEVVRSVTAHRSCFDMMI